MAGAIIAKTGFAGTAVLVQTGKKVIKNMKYINEDSATRFCQLFDAAAVASVTVGTTVPTWIMVAGANGGNDDFVGELVFDNGIIAASTTTATGSGAAASATAHFFVVVE